MIRNLLRFLLLLALVIIAWWLLAKAMILPSLSDLLRRKPLRIAETPLRVEQIRELAELTTCQSLDEVVVDTTRPAENPLRKMLSNPLGAMQDQLVIVVRGSVKAGVRMNEIQEKDMYASADSISIGLPRAVITDLQVNPSGTETFLENGTWNTQAYSALVRKAGEKMQYRAISEGIIGKADQRARMLVEQLVRQSGFKKVHVYTKY